MVVVKNLPKSTVVKKMLTNPVQGQVISNWGGQNELEARGNSQFVPFATGAPSEELPVGHPQNPYPIPFGQSPSKRATMQHEFARYDDPIYKSLGSMANFFGAPYTRTPGGLGSYGVNQLLEWLQHQYGQRRYGAP